jgi:hypothetical protein
VVVVVEGVIDGATVRAGVPTHWRRKMMMEASAWHRGR